jgi:hypothetical protein
MLLAGARFGRVAAKLGCLSLGAVTHVGEELTVDAKNKPSYPVTSS